MSLIGRALAVRNDAPVPMGRPGGALNLAYPYGSAGADDAALLRAYRRNGTARVNIGLLAYTVASQEWKLFRKQPQDGRRRYTTSDQGSDQRTEVVNHQALNVLARPAQVTYEGVTIPAFTRMQMMELAGIWFEATGKAHLIIDRDPRSSIPLGLWPVPPTRMQPVGGGPTNWLRGWIYTSPDGREQIPLDPTDVLFLRSPDPEDLFGGCGALEAVLPQIEAIRSASDWNRNFFLNGARPDGVLQTDGELTDDQFDTLAERWRESHQGTARAHRIAVLENGVTYVPAQQSMRDMDFVQLMAGGGDRVRESIGVGKTMSGVSDDVNRANAQTAQEVYAAWLIRPRLNRWRDLFNGQFLALFGSAGTDVEFDYVYPEPVNREADNAELTAKCAAFAALVGAGADPEDAAMVVGLPAMRMRITARDIPAVPPGWVVPSGPGSQTAEPGAAEPGTAADGPAVVEGGGDAQGGGGASEAGTPGDRLDAEIRALLERADAARMAMWNRAGAR